MVTSTPAHPTEPEPEPDPPQPIPPPEPVPAPEPPHESPPHESTAPPHESTPQSGVDFIDAGPDATEAAFPPPGSFTDETGSLTAETGQTEEIAAVTESIPAVSEMSAPTQDVPTVAAEAPTVWHQPPPTEPFHARHEKPGEWRYDPPEHLAYQHSPPAEVQDPTQLVPALHRPAWEVPLTGDDADRRRRSGLWVSVALTTTLLLCGGGAASAYLLLRDSDAEGAPDPASAVDEFMTAVYTRQDATAAGELVCSEARDREKLTARVEQIKGYAAEYEVPTFRWADPAVDNQNEERATVSVQLTMSTEDEKTAQQQLTFTTIRKTGWLVCEISG
ncbi:hypothetical protein AB0M20_11355 [Actinoplanes sp. NPDC051633]|uniref:Rv0361 family membrane protein n=1 Tax=Actinoplanes sp. NPDC051633 TaxID=3155670 RepID=UPI00342BD2DF